MKVKRYMVFCGEEYYPVGGMRDFRFSVDEIEDVKTEMAAILKKADYIRWYNVLDTMTGECVLDFDYDSLDYKWRSLKDDGDYDAIQDS